MKLIILGATGRVGSQILQLALADKQDVSILIRDSTKQTQFPKQVAITIGDARSFEHIQQAAQGADAIISCLSTDGADVLSVSMSHILSIMQASNIRRIIVVSTAGILQSRSNPALLRYEAGESRRGMTRAVLEHRKMWELLRDTHLDWTMVCPTYLPEGPPTGKFRIEAEKLPEDGVFIHVGDTAQFTYYQLFSNTFFKKRVGICY